MAYNENGKTLSYKITWTEQAVTWLASLKCRHELVDIGRKKTIYHVLSAVPLPKDCIPLMYEKCMGIMYPDYQSLMSQINFEKFS